MRLKSEDWNSGPINWILDVIAPDPLVDEELLKKMGAEKMTEPAG